MPIAYGLLTIYSASNVVQREGHLLVAYRQDLFLNYALMVKIFPNVYVSTGSSLCPHFSPKLTQNDVPK